MHRFLTSRRLVALACLCCAPAAFAQNDTSQLVVPETLDLAPLKTAAAADEDLSPPELMISPPSVVAKPAATPKAAKKVTNASAIGVSKDGPIVLRQGVVALSLSTPEPTSNLSSGASLNLVLPAGAVKAEAKASAGKDDGNWNAFWHRDSAQVQADLKGPMGTALSASGENALSLNYRTADSLGAADASTHVVRTETRTGKVNLSVPVSPAQVTMGVESASAHTEDTSRDKANATSASVRTADHAVYAKADWEPVTGIAVEGGAAAKVANISWQDTTARSATYQSLNPHLSVAMHPWQSANLSAKVEHIVSPYDAAAFATYSRAEGSTVVTGFMPDHAWQVEARLQQQLGPADVTATYTAAKSGTVTEFAEVGGVQAPAPTSLRNRESVAVTVSVPLQVIGLQRTDLTSEARWQSSRVVDPVTQETRAASGETPQTVSLKLSHALPSQKISFGLLGEYTGARTAYQVSELSTTEESGSLGAFLSYKPGPYQIDLNLSGLYGGTTHGDYYAGLRGDSKIKGTSIQDNSGPMLSLSLHKPF